MKTARYVTNAKVIARAQKAVEEEIIAGVDPAGFYTLKPGRVWNDGEHFWVEVFVALPAAVSKEIA